MIHKLSVLYRKTAYIINRFEIFKVTSKMLQLFFQSVTRCNFIRYIVIFLDKIKNNNQ